MEPRVGIGHHREPPHYNTILQFLDGSIRYWVAVGPIAAFRAVPAMNDDENGRNFDDIEKHGSSPRGGAGLGQAWLGRAWLGMAMHGKARLGWAMRGLAGHGEAWQGAVNS